MAVMKSDGGETKEESTNVNRNCDILYSVTIASSSDVRGHRMFRFQFCFFLVCLISGIAINVNGAPLDFDNLKEADRAAFSVRFEKEIWPLLKRNGRDGCVGCHKQKRGTLAFSGKADPDFRTLLSMGFLLPDDPGSILHAVSVATGQQRMPPGKRPRWTKKEVELLRRFLEDVDKKQQK